MPTRNRLRLLLCLSVVSLITQDAAPIQTSKDISIEGEVINDLNELSIPGARVVISSNPSNKFTTVCDSQGHFRFEGLQPKQYWLRAEKPGFMMPGDGPSRWGGGTSVRLTSGQSPGEVKIRLTPVGIISGKITDPSGLAVADSEVEVVQTILIDEKQGGFPPVLERRLSDGKHRLERVGSVRTNDLGDYRLSPLQAGVYFVSAQPSRDFQDSDKTCRNTYYPRSLDLASATPVNLAAGQEAHINIQIISQPGVRVRGRAIRPNGHEIGQARYEYTYVRLSPHYGDSSNTGSVSATIREEGFELTDVMPGKYVLEALTSARDDPGDPRTQKEVLAAWQMIEVGPSDMDGIVIQLQPLREIRGRVKFEENCEPVPVTVRVFGSSRTTRSQIDAKRNADGSFLLSGLVPGRYNLTIQPERRTTDFFIASSALLGSADVLKDGFEVSGEIKDALLITMSCGAAKKAKMPGGVVEGSVLNAARQPVSDVTVLLVSSAEGRASSTLLCDCACSDAAGRFFIKAPPGTYRILACTDSPVDGRWNNPEFLKSCHTEPGLIAVSEGSRAKVDITLPASQQK